MFRLLIKLLIILINLISYFFEKVLNIDLKGYLTSELRHSYKTIKIKNHQIKFFIPSHIIKWRVNTFFEKEPETLNWIQNFIKNKKIIFWDIGSNIGLYSLYAAKINKNIKVTAFEPSFLNLNTLGRNIYINNLQKRISIFQLPIGININKFEKMSETSIYEGGALSSFGSQKDFEGKKIIDVNAYSILGTSLDDIIEKKILEIPDYIKIDVDGIEHLILLGFKKNLKNKKIKSILIEVNENYRKQYKNITKILKKNNFVLKQKEQSKISKMNPDNKNTFNYIYYRK